MPKPAELWTQYKARILIALGAIAALVVAVTTTDVDDNLCQKWDACKDAYNKGTVTEPSPTTVTE